MGCRGGIDITGREDCQTVFIHRLKTDTNVGRAKCSTGAINLDTATSINDMDIPGFNLHPLKGSDKDRWFIWVNGNWRVTFEFHEERVLDGADCASS